LQALSERGATLQSVMNGALLHLHLLGEIMLDQLV
jgi:hypothetical protein